MNRNHAHDRRPDMLGDLPSAAEAGSGDDTAWMQQASRTDPRQAIAVAAARLIADTGADYRSAKQKAAREIFGEAKLPRNALPDTAQIEQALREHLELFDDQHAARLARMRRVALLLMEMLAPFQPLATGAVWKGIATEHAPIHLQLFHDNAKEVQFFLIDQRLNFEPLTVPHFRLDRRHQEVEAFAFEYRNEPVLVSVYPHDDLRGALLPAGDDAERGNRPALQARLQMSANPA
jgi:hypothetical protein